MKKLVLAFACLVYSITSNSQNIFLENITANQTFEVWISEGNELIFNGFVYPNRKVIVPMTANKLYGILHKQISNKTTPKNVREVKIHSRAKTFTINDIVYYFCTESSLCYFLSDEKLP